MAIMKKVLFICDGNVGRSQMAEGFYNKYKRENSAISAGIEDVGAKYNYVPRIDIVLAMKEKGIDISGQRIKQVTKQMLSQVQTIVVLCNPKSLPSFIKESGIEIIARQVDDPSKSDNNGVLKVRDDIEKIVLSLL